MTKKKTRRKKKRKGMESRREKKGSVGKEREVTCNRDIKR